MGTNLMANETLYLTCLTIYINNVTIYHISFLIIFEFKCDNQIKDIVSINNTINSMLYNIFIKGIGNSHFLSLSNTHMDQRNLDLFSFQRTNLSIIRILKTNLNYSSY